MNPTNEANVLVNTMVERLPSHIDGRRAIRAMKKHDSNNWRQMEWIGFYVEEVAQAGFDCGKGPTIDNTTFDLGRENVWDFKAHTTHNQSGKKRYQMYLNSANSMEELIERDGLGFIIVHGDAEYDEDDSFYHWHQELKGGPSEYTKKRRERGAPSRTRKKAFDVDRVTAHYFDSIDALDEAIDSGWLRRTGQGRNCDGSSRTDKYMLKPHKVPSSATIVERKV